MGFQNYEEGLFACYFEFEFGRVTVCEIDGCFISSQFFNFFCNGYFSAIDLISFLLADCTADLKRSNSTEDLATCSCFGSKFNGTVLQLRDNEVDFSQHFVFLFLQLLQLLIQLFAVRWICFDSKFLRDEEITAIAITNLHHFMSGSQVRSEERRVGNECSARGSTEQRTKTVDKCILD